MMKKKSISKILIATANPAKIKEIKEGLKELEDYKIKILTLKDFRIKDKPKETGKTFCENAKIKAKFYGKLTKCPTISDDAGLIIPFLNNEPGVKSRLWLGYEASDQELIDYTLKRLSSAKNNQRRAYLQTCLCFYFPDFEENKELFFYAEEKIEGWIAEKPSRFFTVGYPFRAIFIVKKFKKYYDELTQKEHQIINHRLKAIKKLVSQIKRNFILRSENGI